LPGWLKATGILALMELDGIRGMLRRLLPLVITVAMALHTCAEAIVHARSSLSLDPWFQRCHCAPGCPPAWLRDNDSC